MLSCRDAVPGASSPANPGMCHADQNDVTAPALPSVGAVVRLSAWQGVPMAVKNES
jgi:hypothetical protein